MLLGSIFGGFKAGTWKDSRLLCPGVPVKSTGFRSRGIGEDRFEESERTVGSLKEDMLDEVELLSNLICWTPLSMGSMVSSIIPPRITAARLALGAIFGGAKEETLSGRRFGEAFVSLLNGLEDLAE